MTRDLFSDLPAKALGRRSPKRSGPVTLDELVRGRALAARAVTLYGDRYMPLFERLDREIAAQSTRAETLARVRALAGEVA